MYETKPKEKKNNPDLLMEILKASSEKEQLVILVTTDKTGLRREGMLLKEINEQLYTVSIIFLLHSIVLPNVVAQHTKI